ncbi:hypothetical protein ACO0KY_05485 [Undibacterium sp. Dicai25W]
MAWVATQMSSDPGLTGRSMRKRTGKASQAGRNTVRLAAPCLCGPVNSDVRRHE